MITLDADKIGYKFNFKVYVSKFKIDWHLNFDIAMDLFLMIYNELLKMNVAVKRKTANQMYNG